MGFKVHRNEFCRLKGKLKKSGFDRWRFITAAFSCVTGEEKTFFIEFYTVNPFLSPKKCILGFDNSLEKNNDEFTFSLENIEEALKRPSKSPVIPSFTMIRAGVASENQLQINNFHALEKVDFMSKDAILSVLSGDGKRCVIGPDFTAGSVSLTEEESESHPEYFSSTGTISWNLKFDRKIPFYNGFGDGKLFWAVPGGKCEFSGSIFFNGEEFSVSPETSFGYYDKNWGEDFTSPFFHLSSSNVTSAITGKLQEKSFFALQGEYNGGLNFIFSSEGKMFNFNSAKNRNIKVSKNFSENSAIEGDENKMLHWSVSSENRRYVMDVDIFCKVGEMFLRDYESPMGNRKVMRVIGSSCGNGRLKIYLKRRKNLELIEQVEIKRCVCEYGDFELNEN